MTSQTLRNQLLATEGALVRGLIAPMFGRLGDHLRTCQKPFITVGDCEIRDMHTGATSESPEVHVPLDAILWAHEFVALGGDEHLRLHYQAEDEILVRLVLERPPALVIEGLQTRASLVQGSRFFVLKQPRATGSLAVASAHAQAMAALPYVLVNRSALCLVATGTP